MEPDDLNVLQERRRSWKRSCMRDHPKIVYEEFLNG